MLSLENRGSARSNRRTRRLLAVATVMFAGAAGAGEARAADGSTGLGIELPGVEVKLPAVEVKLPPVEVNLAPVEVKVPAVEVRLPPADVKLPAVEVKLPPAEVKLPPPEVKAPQPDGPAPPSTSDAPASAAPRSPAGTHAAPAATPARGQGATAGDMAQAPRGDAGGGGSADRRDATSRTRARRADPRRDDAAAPRATGGRARGLRRLVRRLSGCLGALDSVETRVLTLRAGSATRPPLTRRQVARRLDVGVRRVAAVERRGLERLRGQARAGGCGAQPAPDIAATPAGTGSGAAPPPASATTLASAPSKVSRGRSGVVEAVEGALGGRIAPRLTPSVLLFPASSPPLLILLVGGFLVGFVVVWMRDSGIRRAVNQST